MYYTHTQAIRNPAQNRELCALAQEVTTEVAAPIKTGVSKAFNKAT
jgi:hypothetical protein